MGDESQEYTFLQYMNATRSIDTEDETFGCDFLKWTIDDGVNHSLRKSTGISMYGGLNVG